MPLKSPSAGVSQRILQFRFSVALYERNYRELRLLLAHLTHPLVAHEMSGVSESWLELEAMREVMFLLHNYVSAAQSLVDHSRVLYRELYGPSGSMRNYQAEVDKRFLKDPLTQFVLGLRQMTQHQRLPSIRMHTEFRAEPEGGTEEIRFELPVAELRRFSGWKAPAKEYLADAGDAVDVAATTAAYHARVTDFHTWFATRQAEVHGPALDEFEHLVRYRGRSPEAVVLADVERRVAALEAARPVPLQYAHLRDALSPVLSVLDTRLLTLCEQDGALWIDEALASARRRFAIPSSLRARLRALAVS